ncbi:MULTISPECIES: DUF86 domain-containing protein [Shouchella]|uniref:DUF86 domain-containing protein n=1 Tax=Shouchella clausii (strain KSM-K16) TaxID=66692 RepID=Q5WDT0_SHOC1|nr:MULTISPECIES: DUF86 domain-containing protein [Shouchella]MCM3381383.1 DUF86 domain-containing protein [Shouchella rhizosphaerae]MCM3547655.1 DUF86 domain-containing protein [Shouchella clausii]PAD18820.1 DUF86 domain-containing protein [Shouchella clausii]PAD46781.1 DUF86 domain-containing protein [Shouchella clausii]PAE82777.1 DUF86 domain-containing protein [Shouchella clausii]
MYFVDRQRIEQTLNYMEHLLKMMKEEAFGTSDKDRLALERTASVLIEAVIDVGNQMIDAFIMRDPGGYEDIIDILLDEKVITDETAAGLKQLIRRRKALVYQYASLEANDVWSWLQESQPSLEAFPPAVRQYLKNELGVITAFLPDKDTR